MGRRHRFAASAAAIALAFAAPSVAIAQQQTYSFDIPAQDLGSALRAFAKTTRQQISFNGEMVRGKRSNALKGSHSASAGLEILLRDSGLTTRRAERGVLVLTPVTDGAGFQPRGAGGAGNAVADIGEAVPFDQMDQAIVVTGSHIRGSAPAGANIISLKRDDLKKTGRGTLAEAIQTLPQVHGGGANDATARTGVGAAPNEFARATGGGSSLNLRGLGVEETLTLVNGRRLAPAGDFGAFADISALPMGAVERVEILADGASATYGADAMAGVVNIIMDRNFEGAETRMRAGLETRSGQPDFHLGQTIGWAFDGGQVLVAADFASQHGITAQGRPFAQTADLRPLGGTDWRVNRPFCSPGNILFPSELAGAIPSGQNGTTLNPSEIRNGLTNLCDLADPKTFYMVPQHEKGSLYLHSFLDAAEGLRLSADILASKRHTRSTDAYEFALLTVPTSNAFRQMNGFHGTEAPLNDSIYILYQFTELPLQTNVADAWSFAGTLGGSYQFGGDWELAVSGGYGRYDNTLKYKRLDQGVDSALERALASSDPATAFNPFSDGSYNSRELVKSFLNRHRFVQYSNYRAADVNLGGSLFELPGGAVKLAVGGEYRREGFASEFGDYDAGLSSYISSSVIKADRDVKAVYGELFLPLFSKINSTPGAHHLSVSVSGRYDHYSDFGGSINPKVGATWSPVEGLTLKGSYGSSFKAPLLPKLYGRSLAYMLSLFPPQDLGSVDANGDGAISTLFLGGGNPALKPEKGKSWTAGIEIEPARMNGLRLHATYFNLRFNDRFAEVPNWPPVFANPAAYEGIAYFPLPSQSLVESLLASIDDAEIAPSRLAGLEAIIDLRTKNFATQVMDGVDAGFDYVLEAPGSTFNVSASASYLARYKSRLGQSLATTSYVGDVGLPSRWKARGGLGWTRREVSLNAWVNHTAGYTNKMSEPDEPVSSYTTIDLSAAVRLGGLLRRPLGDDASLSFYVTNLFDESPPFVNNFGVGFDGANADLVGRRVAVQLTTRW